MKFRQTILVLFAVSVLAVVAMMIGLSTHSSTPPIVAPQRPQKGNLSHAFFGHNTNLFPNKFEFMHNLKQGFKHKRASGREPNKEPKHEHPQSGPELDIIQWGVTSSPIDGDQETRNYTHEELMERFSNIDIVWTWVNGSDAQHIFKKLKWMKKKEAKKFERIIMTHGRKENYSIEQALYDFTGTKLISSRDRESDELRFSFRSMAENVQWHSGRFIVVCPGHVPVWLEPVRNFAAKSRAADPLSRRIIIVHQDSILIPKVRRTMNTNTIEPNLHKLQGLTELFIHFNDDYFVNRKTDVTDFVNIKGGPILLFERNYVHANPSQLAKLKREKAKIWLGSVYNTHVALEPALQPEADTPKVQRFAPFFVKHAPFVYCKNMIRNAISRRLSGRLVYNGVHHPHRNHSDVLVPFYHNGLIMSKPWAGSPSGHVAKLNNIDSCAPALRKVGASASARLVVVKNDMEENKRNFDLIRNENPQFFALNDGFQDPRVREVIPTFLKEKWPFPTPYEVEHPAAFNTEADMERFHRFINLPLLALLPTTLNACPFIRSLRFALSQFNGSVTVAAPDSGLSKSVCALNERVDVHDLQLTTVNISALLQPAPPPPARSVLENDWPTAIVFDLRPCTPDYCMIGQTLAYEDFAVTKVDNRRVFWLEGIKKIIDVLPKEKETAMPVNMIVANSEKDLLKTFPFPYPRYESTQRPIFW